MARPLRIQYPGAVYHVMNRGSSRQKVFLDTRDYEVLSPSGPPAPDSCPCLSKWLCIAREKALRHGGAVD
jgi:hypothetical protein